MFRNVQEVYEAICREVGKDPGSSANGHCPVHEDTHASFEVKILDDGKIWFKCYKGCDKSEILKQLGFEWSDLFPDDSRPKIQKQKKKRNHIRANLTVTDVAEYVKLPVAELALYGLKEEIEDYWGRYVRLHYWDIDGNEYPYTRMRRFIKAPNKDNPKYCFQPTKDKKRKPLVYGEWKLKEFREQGWCVFVEGETDCWTLWHHDYPAIGIMGAANVKGSLKKQHIEGLREIYVFCEPGDGGDNFRDGFAEKLYELKYEGKVYRLTLPEHKDPSELHKAVGGDFKKYFQQALDLKKPLELKASKEKKDSRYARQLTEMGNAERLILQHGADLIYCHDWKKWLIWDGVRWEVDRVGTIKKKAKETVRSIYKEASKIEDDKDRSDYIKWASRSEQARVINSMIELATTEPGVPVVPEHLDQDKYLLTCRNGTVDLRTGKLMDSLRENRITKCADVEYVTGAECPTFLQFLEQIFEGNQTLVDFIQRAIGYTLTGEVTERSLFILWGVGKNGKSTLLEVIQSLLGDYSMRTPTDTLMVQYGGGSGIPNDIARLKGARFVSASESEEGQKLAESKLKDLTGGETISARFMRGEFFDFLPEFKLWLSTNHKPVIRGTDNAIWDRIKLIPFTYRVPDDQMDKQLPIKLKNELPGVFQWAIRGCIEWQQKGLGLPEVVVDAVNEYRSDMDILGRFLSDWTQNDKYSEVMNKDLWKKYQEWSKENDIHTVSNVIFSRRIKERGFEQHKTNKGVKWLGLRLLDEVNEEDLTSYVSDGVTGSDAESHFDSHKRTGEKQIGKPVTTRHPVTDDNLPEWLQD